MSRFAFETEYVARSRSSTLRGELDLLATAALEPELERLADEPGVDVVALDLRALDFLDSSGLRAIVLAASRLDATTSAGSCSCAARRPFSACSRSRA